MESSTKIIVAIAVVAAIVVVIVASFILGNGLAPLEHREDKTTNEAAQNVEIQATSFNGDIEIQASTGEQIEVTYSVEAPTGHLNEIVTSTTNQTQNDITRIVTDAKIVNSNNAVKVNYRANMVIKVPSHSLYNLTLNTLNGNIKKPLINDSVIIASTNNGRIDIKDNNATSIDASSQNGNVNISLVQGTLFKVDATSANGHVTYQGIAMNTSTQTTNRLTGNTTGGSGNLTLTLSTANGNVTIDYFSE